MELVVITELGFKLFYLFLFFIFFSCLFQIKVQHLDCLSLLQQLPFHHHHVKQLPTFRGHLVLPNEFCHRPTRSLARQSFGTGKAILHCRETGVGRTCYPPVNSSAQRGKIKRFVKVKSFPDIVESYSEICSSKEDIPRRDKKV